MKPRILIVMSILLVLGYGITVNGKTNPVRTNSKEKLPGTQLQDVYREDIALTAGGNVYYDCHLFENANYYLRFVYLYAGQHTIAGRVKFSVQRRDGEYLRLRVEYLTGDYGWELLESHLYVGTEPPKKMAPGRFPYQQETPPGLTKHQYYIDLEDIGSSFETVYIAVHAVVQKVNTKIECSSTYPVGEEETAWGFKTLPKYYPPMQPGDIVNAYGDPWGTIFPKGKKQWPAYLMAYIPYNVSDPWFECPQPLQLIFQF